VSATPAWRLQRPSGGRLQEQSEHCRFLDHPVNIGVRRAGAVDDRLVELVEERPTVEVGGWAIGVLRSNFADVLRVSGPGPNAICTAERYSSDVEHDVAIADACRGTAEAVIGCWHSHVPREFKNPSEADLASWSLYRHAFGVDAWLSLIVVSDLRGGWTLEEFVTTAGVGSRDVCRPLTT
jgi:Prokaryotic homologs of the JAB domain